MRQVTLTEFNRAIQKANNKNNKVEIIYEGETRTGEPGSARTIGAGSDPGVYVARIHTPQEGEAPASIAEIYTTIEAPAVEPIHTPPPYRERGEITEAALSNPTLLLIELRKQDQTGMQQERDFHKKQLEDQRLYYENLLKGRQELHEKEIERLKADHRAEVDRINADWKYKLSMTENNQLKLETEREELYKTIEKRLRREERFSKLQDRPGFMDRIMENPIAMAFLAKQMGIDTSGLAGLVGATGGQGESSAMQEIINMLRGQNGKATP